MRTDPQPTRRTLALLGSCIVVGLVGVGAALSADPPDLGLVVNACVIDSTGQGRPLAAPNVMIVPRGRECPTGWSAIAWNKQGPAGARGPRGPAGPSAAFSRFRDGPIDASRSRDDKGRPAKSVLQLDVPPGNYVVSAKVVATTKLRKGGLSRWAFIVRCMLESGADFDLAQAGDLTEEVFTHMDSATLALNVVHRFEGAGPHTIHLKCTDAPGTRYAELRDMKVTAIQVGALTNMPQHGGVNP